MSPKQKYPSIRLFRNPVLEWLTHVHPITPLLVWTPVTLWLWVQGLQTVPSLVELGLLSFAGLLSWTLAEYLLHRFVFHAKPSNRFGKRLVYLFHGLHHEDPVDPSRLVMPPIPGLLIASALYLIFQSMLGPIAVKPFFAFFLLGYLFYDYIHFAVHHFNPRTRVGKYLKKSHMLHHYVSPDARWGVSSPLWDLLLGTLQERPRARVQQQTGAERS